MVWNCQKLGNRLFSAIWSFNIVCCFPTLKKKKRPMSLCWSIQYYFSIPYWSHLKRQMDFRKSMEVSLLVRVLVSLILNFLPKMKCRKLVLIDLTFLYYQTTHSLSLSKFSTEFSVYKKNWSWTERGNWSRGIAYWRQAWAPKQYPISENKAK